jgi:lipopolysaccharide transport system ATP-binding protein
MTEPAIALRGVSKSFPRGRLLAGGLKAFLLRRPAANEGPAEVLRDVSLEAAPGEVVGLVGRNGSGKSTLLRLIAGILRPTRGEIRVRGRICPFLEPTAGFHPELTGRENALLAAVVLGFTRREALRRIDEVVAFSELGDRIDQPIRTYSSGMLARIGFSVVAAADPEILLVDELSVGDAGFREKCLAKMREFKSRGVTMAYVSHAEDDVRRLCDRVVWLDRGAVRRVGPPDAILPEYLDAVRPPPSRRAQERPHVV